jgi:hypothetical protein
MSAYENLYSLDESKSYSIKLKTVIDSKDYITVNSVRNKCLDANLKTPIVLSYHGKILNVSDCAMDEMDAIRHYRQKTCFKNHKNMSLIASVVAFFTILSMSVYNQIA